MAKDEIDDLIAAVATVDVLKNTLADQARLIAGILTELDQLRARIAAVEGHPAKATS